MFSTAPVLETNTNFLKILLKNLYYREILFLCWAEMNANTILQRFKVLEEKRQKSDFQKNSIANELIALIGEAIKETKTFTSTDDFFERIDSLKPEEPPVNQHLKDVLRCNWGGTINLYAWLKADESAVAEHLLFLHAKETRAPLINGVVQFRHGSRSEYELIFRELFKEASDKFKSPS